ncbi:MAG: transglutaminase family protein [Candidatus Nezhaarchaeota archaeon]|nr:transglutaminase family protein [Candidatus Nezhaarchaeota archaeon]
MYLAPTPLIQSNNPEIVEYARRLSSPSIEQTVKNVYLFVRDEIKWTIDKVKPAVDVLKSRKGSCFNKASLQIALLRALNIPARYRLEEVLAIALKPYLPQEVYDLIPKTVIHALTEVYLGGKWLGCDATIDSQLSHPLWKRNWEVGMDMSCIPSIFKVKVVGSYPDLPIALISENMRTILLREDLTLKIEKHLDNLRALPLDEKLKHFEQCWGSDVISYLVKRGRK